MTDDADPITLTVEIDPAEFDEPRQLMYDRLVEEFGHETVAELVGANLQQDLTAQRAICWLDIRCWPAVLTELLKVSVWHMK